MGEIADDDWSCFEDFMTEDPKLAYLEFLRDVVFGSREDLEVVKCRKFPEFGTIDREDIQNVIDKYIRYGSSTLLDLTGQEGAWAATLDYDGPQKGDQVKILDIQPIGHAAKVAQAYFDRDPSVTEVEIDGKSYFRTEQHAIISHLSDAYDRNITYGTGHAISSVSYDYNITKGPNMFDADFYRRQADVALATAEKVEGVPQTDIFEVGNVISFTKDWRGEQEYHFAAVKVDGGWAITGNRQVGNLYNWQMLLEFIGISSFDTIMVLNSGERLKDYYKAMKAIESGSFPDAKVAGYVKETVVE